MSIKVLLDTDIGSDIDDAVALAYLLRQPECELVGITAVTGEPVKRASLASALCRAAGKQVPIYPGAAQPLQIEQRQPLAPQASALLHWSHQTDFPEGEAVDFMRRVIRAHPGEVILLTIAPLTNIAQLFQADPEIPALLKGVYTMGGIFSPAYPNAENGEWNLVLDPQATEIVYRTPLRLHRSVGLEITTQVTLSADQVRVRFQAPILKPVLDFAAVWFEGGASKLTFHDPLTAATIFDPSICEFAPGTVEPDLSGRTRFEPGGVGAPHEVAVSVNPARFLEHYFEVVS